MHRQLAVALLVATPLVAQSKIDYQADVKFAIEAIGAQCRTLLDAKDIDWKKVTAPLLAESKKTKTPAQHLLLLVRLLARLRDGHAEVRPLPAGKDVRLDLPERSHGPGMFLCTSGGRVLIKNVWGPAAGVGLQPGMELVTIAGQPAVAWLGKRGTDLADLISFSTPQQAAFFTCHQGLADVAGTQLEVEVKDGTAAKKRTIRYAKGSQVPLGPAFPPSGLRSEGDVHFGTTAAGHGYVHVRRCRDDLPTRMDAALQALGDVPGLILDFRGNSGGGFDHEALFGRFVPAGATWQQYASAGPRPYGGPMVVIVDGTVRSAGETASGMFGEDGRAYTIGESATAGMSSQKKTIALPSQLFELYVSVASNKARFQGGRGLEGVGYEPMQVVAFDAADLAQQVDTLIRRAGELLTGPLPKVRYDPAKHGWSPAARK